MHFFINPLFNFLSLPGNISSKHILFFYSCYREINLHLSAIRQRLTRRHGGTLEQWVVDKHSFYDHLKFQCLHDLHHQDDLPLPKAAFNEGVIENKNV